MEYHNVSHDTLPFFFFYIEENQPKVAIKCWNKTALCVLEAKSALDRESRFTLMLKLLLILDFLA